MGSPLKQGLIIVLYRSLFHLVVNSPTVMSQDPQLRHNGNLDKNSNIWSCKQIWELMLKNMSFLGLLLGTLS